MKLEKGIPWRLEKRCLHNAARLALPLALERIVLGGTHVAATRIVAPLGTVAVAADSLAVTAESFCYGVSRENSQGAKTNISAPVH